MDFGPAGRRHTVEVLRTLGMVPYGPLEQVAITPVFRDERMTLVGLIGFTTYPHAYNLLDLARSIAIVDSVRPLVDILVVTFHGGAEGTAAVRTGTGAEFLGKEPRGNLRRWARAVIDAGADAVVGHGPHVLRGVEFYRGRPVFYSLGNFLTYRGFNLEGPLGQTTVLELELDGDGRFRSARMPLTDSGPAGGPGTRSRRRALRLLQPGDPARLPHDRRPHRRRRNRSQPDPEPIPSPARVSDAGRRRARPSGRRLVALTWLSLGSRRPEAVRTRRPRSPWPVRATTGPETPGGSGSGRC